MHTSTLLQPPTALGHHLMSGIRGQLSSVLSLEALHKREGVVCAGASDVAPAGQLRLGGLIAQCVPRRVRAPAAEVAHVFAIDEPQLATRRIAIHASRARVSGTVDEVCDIAADRIENYMRALPGTQVEHTAVFVFHRPSVRRNR